MSSYSGEDAFHGLSLSIDEIALECKPGFQYKVVKVDGKNARWYESEITVKDNGKERNIVERALSWEEDGLTYLLTNKLPDVTPAGSSGQATSRHPGIFP